jgi:hypothetical protein
MRSCAKFCHYGSVRQGPQETKTSTYVINNYFYPKCLKSIKRVIDPKDEEQKQKLLRW